jgi:SNF2 family DNA or RNA helicase
MKLAPYQEVARDRLLANDRYILADEAGLGKTGPTIMAAWASRHWPHPTLVTAPNYLLDNWQRELAQWVPEARVLVADGERSKRQAVFESADADFILTGYHTWHSYPILQKRKWGTLVFDEAHRLRGRNSQWTKKVFQLQNVGNKNRDSRFWFLTGTPIVRDAGDVWPLLHLMDRDVYRGYWDFVERVCHVTTTPWEKQIGGVKDPKAFVSMVGKYSLRRLARNIPELQSLEHTERDVWVKLPTSVYTAMRRAKKEYMLEHEGMDTVYADGAGALTSILSQICTTPPTKENPKLDALAQVLEDIPVQERVGVFAWYRKSVYAAAEKLIKAGRKVFVITGDTRSDMRNRYILEWNDTPGAVLIATIAALKEGVNLQAGHNVVFLEESDLPADNDQVLARFKRRGQAHPVRMTRILATGPSMDATRRKHVDKRDVLNKRAMLEEILKEL